MVILFAVVMVVRAQTNSRAFDSLAPAHSPSGLPVYVARRPPAPFCETPIRQMSTATPILPDRRLWLGFFHHGRANRLAFFDELDLTMFGEACSCRNQMTHNHAFLEASQL